MDPPAVPRKPGDTCPACETTPLSKRFNRDLRGRLVATRDVEKGKARAWILVGIIGLPLLGLGLIFIGIGVWKMREVRRFIADEERGVWVIGCETCRATFRFEEPLVKLAEPMPA